jgi:hypothetical protein
VVALLEMVTGAATAGFDPAAAIVTVDGTDSAAALLVVNCTTDAVAAAEISFTEQVPDPPGTIFTGVHTTEDNAPGINNLMGIEVEVPFSMAAKLAT